jgi:ACR3 family arsenite transporter
MIFPMMLKIDFGSIVNAMKMPKGLAVTLTVNWLINPSPCLGLPGCSSMSFQGHHTCGPGEGIPGWCCLTGGGTLHSHGFRMEPSYPWKPCYTLVQVAINDLIILVAFIPIVTFLLGISGISIPWNTLLMSVVLFVVIPLLSAALSGISSSGIRALNISSRAF